MYINSIVNWPEKPWGQSNKRMYMDLEYKIEVLRPVYHGEPGRIMEILRRTTGLGTPLWTHKQWLMKPKQKKHSLPVDQVEAK